MTQYMEYNSPDVRVGGQMFQDFEPYAAGNIHMGNEPFATGGMPGTPYDMAYFKATGGKAAKKSGIYCGAPAKGRKPGTYDQCKKKGQIRLWGYQKVPDVQAARYEQLREEHLKLHTKKVPSKPASSRAPVGSLPHLEAAVHKAMDNPTSANLQNAKAALKKAETQAAKSPDRTANKILQAAKKALKHVASASHKIHRPLPSNRRLGEPLKGKVQHLKASFNRLLKADKGDKKAAHDKFMADVAKELARAPPEEEEPLHVRARQMDMKANKLAQQAKREKNKKKKAELKEQAAAAREEYHAMKDEINFEKQRQNNPDILEDILKSSGSSKKKPKKKGKGMRHGGQEDPVIKEQLEHAPNDSAEILPTGHVMGNEVPEWSDVVDMFPPGGAPTLAVMEDFNTYPGSQEQYIPEYSSMFPVDHAPDYNVSYYDAPQEMHLGPIEWGSPYTGGADIHNVAQFMDLGEVHDMYEGMEHEPRIQQIGRGYSGGGDGDEKYRAKLEKLSEDQLVKILDRKYPQLKGSSARYMKAAHTAANAREAETQAFLEHHSASIDLINDRIESAQGLLNHVFKDLAEGRQPTKADLINSIILTEEIAESFKELASRVSGNKPRKKVLGEGFWGDFVEGFKRGADIVRAPLNLLSYVPGIGQVAGPISAAVSLIPSSTKYTDQKNLPGEPMPPPDPEVMKRYERTQDYLSGIRGHGYSGGSIPFMNDNQSRDRARELMRRGCAVMTIEEERGNAVLRFCLP